MTEETSGGEEKEINTSGDSEIDKQRVADSLKRIKKNIEDERERNNGGEETTPNPDDSETE